MASLVSHGVVNRAKFAPQQQPTFGATQVPKFGATQVPGTSGSAGVFDPIQPSGGTLVPGTTQQQGNATLVPGTSLIPNTNLIPGITLPDIPEAQLDPNLGTNPGTLDPNLGKIPEAQLDPNLGTNPGGTTPGTNPGNNSVNPTTPGTLIPGIGKPPAGSMADRYRIGGYDEWRDVGQGPYFQRPGAAAMNPIPGGNPSFPGLPNLPR